MIEIRVPVEYNNTPRYVITYIIIGIMFNIASYHVIMSEVVMQAYLIPLICQYAVLSDCFENVFNDCAESFKGKLGSWEFCFSPGETKRKAYSFGGPCMFVPIFMNTVLINS